MWMYNNFYDDPQNVLMHHGILGQKWGVRRFQNGDGSLTPAGRERYGVKNKAEYGMSTTAAIALFYLSPYIAIGGAAAAEHIYHKSFEKKTEKERSNSKTDPKTGLLLKNDTEMSEKDDMKRVNPTYYKNEQEAAHNCMLCTTAYDMRRRGYEVTARKVFTGFTDDTVKKWYPKAQIKKISAKDANGDDSTKALVENTKKALLDQGNGARGNLMLSWTNGGGHSVVYEVKNNKLIIRDCQNNQTYNDYDNYISNSREVTYARLDNVDFDAKKIKEAVR